MCVRRLVGLFVHTIKCTAAIYIILREKAAQEESQLREMEGDYPKKPLSAPTSKLRVISDTAALVLTTVVLLGTFAASYLANNAGIIFQNTTGEISDKYSTQVKTIAQGAWLGTARN